MGGEQIVVVAFVPFPLSNKFLREEKLTLLPAMDSGKERSEATPPDFDLYSTFINAAIAGHFSAWLSAQDEFSGSFPGGQRNSFWG
jgi:hypothetical protein